jgi:hypothetical protein
LSGWGVNTPNHEGGRLEKIQKWKLTEKEKTQNFYKFILLKLKKSA